MEKEILYLRILIGLAAVLCGLMIAYHVFFSPSMTVDSVTVMEASSGQVLISSLPEKKVPEKKISLNTASKEELDAIPGVGPVLAEKILEYREKNHGFRIVEELKKISGIGESNYEKIRDYVTVE